MLGKMREKRVGCRLAKGFLAAAMACVGVAGTVQAATPTKPLNTFFDWSVPSEDGGASYTPAPFLDDSNFASVDAMLAARVGSDPTALLAVKVVSPLTSAGAKAIFDKYNVSYVFADYESNTALIQTQSLVSLVKASTKSSAAFVGNFSLSPLKNDPTRPAGLGSTTPVASGGHSLFTISQYQTAKVNMANPALYPGAPDFRNKADGNAPTAPNIRSSLFVLPIERLSLVRATIPNSGGPSFPIHQIIPWVSRFNNFGNAGLDSDGDSTNGYNFVQNAANPADGQLLSRGDFEAQILHYRMRGAHSYNLFNYTSPNSSIVGYSSDQERADALTGWNQPAASAVFNRGHYTFAAGGLTSNVIIDPFVQKTSEETGIIWSGVYDTTGSTGIRQLVVLLSNLGNVDQVIDIPKVGGIPTFETTIPTKQNDDYAIAAGQHRILEFTLTNGKWVLTTSSDAFTDDNRNGVGVPEPMSASMLALGAAGLLLRRKRR